MIHGSCLCGRLRIEVARIATMAHCHCSMCRRAYGAAFATFASAAANDFRLVQGDDLIMRFESSPGSFRAFCSVCGSNAPTFSSDGDSVYIPAGMLDDDPGIRPAFHVYVGLRASWWLPHDTLPKYVEWPVDDA